VHVFYLAHADTLAIPFGFNEQSFGSNNQSFGFAAIIPPTADETIACAIVSLLGPHNAALVTKMRS
jgi:hypothetical protein